MSGRSARLAGAAGQKILIIGRRQDHFHAAWTAATIGGVTQEVPDGDAESLADVGRGRAAGQRRRQDRVRGLGRRQLVLRGVRRLELQRLV